MRIRFRSNDADPLTWEKGDILLFQEKQNVPFFLSSRHQGTTVRNRRPLHGFDVRAKSCRFAPGSTVAVSSDFA
jgi:hypothetical protein